MLKIQNKKKTNMKINQGFFSWKTTKKWETLMEKVKEFEIRKCIQTDNTDYIISLKSSF
jgi:uncharacterized membrane protein